MGDYLILSGLTCWTESALESEEHHPHTHLSCLMSGGLRLLVWAEGLMG